MGVDTKFASGPDAWEASKGYGFETVHTHSHWHTKTRDEDAGVPTGRPHDPMQTPGLDTDLSGWWLVSVNGRHFCSLLSSSPERPCHAMPCRWACTPITASDNHDIVSHHPLQPISRHARGSLSVQMRTSQHRRRQMRSVRVLDSSAP